MRARMSLRWTVTLFTGFFLAASLGLVLFATLSKFRAQWAEDAVLQARRAARLLARTSHEALRLGDLSALDQLVRQAAGDDAVERVIVAGRHGEVIADSAPGQEAPALLRAVPRLQGSDRVQTDGARAQVLVPITHGRTPLGAVFILCSTHEQQAMLLAVRDWGILMVAITILVACATAYFLAAIIATPIRRMAHSMQAVARGQLHQRLPEEGCCEVRRMAHSFNHMSAALWRRMREMESLQLLGLAVSSSLYLYKVAQAAVESVQAVLPDTRAQIWLSDLEREHLVEATMAYPEENGLAVPLGEDCLLSRAYHRRQVLRAGGPEDGEPADPWLRAHFGAASAVALPLVAQSEGVGVLTVLRPEGAEPLQAEDLPFLQAAANQIALALENARMYGREARVASVFQRVLLPPPATIPGLEIAARWRPAPGETKVTGDYYDFIALPNGRWGIVIGDVCGKGTIAASYTAMAKYVLRSYAYESDSPAQILQRTNAALYAQFTGGLSEEAPMFITLLCALYEPETGRFSYAHAGHPLGTLARVDSRVAIALDRGGPPLGVLADAVYHEETLYLSPGDTVALYTDGVVEAARDEHVLEPEHIAAILLAHQEDSAQRVADALLDEVVRLANGEAPDDVTLMILRAGTGVDSLPMSPPPAGLAAS